MIQHPWPGRSDNASGWFTRRTALKAAAALVAANVLPLALAQQRTNLVDLRGDALLNGSRLQTGSTVQTGDTVQTGPGSRVIFTMGNAAFLVRENTFMAVERGATLNTVSLLRLMAGAVASVWQPGSNAALLTPTLTASLQANGVAGNGVYAEVLPGPGRRTYVCNCYGTLALNVSGLQRESLSDYHQCFFAEASPRDGRLLTPAALGRHADEEMEGLAALVGQRTAWQMRGRKGVPDGSGLSS